MRSLAREGARLAALLLVSAVVVLQLVRDRGAGRSNTVEGEEDTLSLDLPSMENIRFLTGRKKGRQQQEEEEATSRRRNIDSEVEAEMGSSTRPPPPVYSGSLETLRHATITPPGEVTHTPGDIDVGFILINLQRTESLDIKTEFKVERTFSSMLTFSSAPSLHFLVVTDRASLRSIAMFFAHFISKRVSEAVIMGPDWRRWLRVPTIRITFVDIVDIRKLDEPFIAALKRNTEAKEEEKVDKYSSDLFYIGPLYAKAFTQLQKLIFLDAMDLDFFDDIVDLHHQFAKLGAEAVMGVGVDTSPHYRKFLGRYLETHPDTKLGLPGPQQGLNTGVVLYQLETMRHSSVYQDYLRPAKVDSLIQKYAYNLTVGDQDWFTNLAWDQPQLFYILPCVYNAQTNIQLLRPPWEEVFDSYHYCAPRTQLKIVHRNGCGPVPQLCGYTPDPDSEYWRGKKNFYVDLHVNIEGLWSIISDMIRGQSDFKLFSYL